MPVFTEETAPRRRSRLGRSLLLFLMPLAALLLILVTLTVQPLHMGPYVLGTEYFPGPDRWSVQWVSHTSGAALVLDCQGWTYAIGWYRGRRLR